MSQVTWKTDTYLEESLADASNNVFSFPRRPHRVIVGSPRFDWWRKAQERLQRLVSLDRGWDGYSALPVRFQNAYFAANVLSRVCSDDTPEPNIVPGVDGDLQIEWHVGSLVLELHILEPNNVRACYYDEESEDVAIEYKITTNFSRVVDTLDAMKGECFDRATAKG